MTEPNAVDTAAEEEIAPLDPSPVEPEPERQRKTYPFTLQKADARKLSEEFSAALGKGVLVTFITPGQDGHEPVLWIEDENFKPVEMDPAQVEQLLTAHIPPPPPETRDQRRARHLTAANSANSVIALRTAVAKLMEEIL